MAAIFVISALVSVAGAVLMVARRNPVYGLLFLLTSFGGAAGVFYSMHGTFLAVSQVLVYAGAIAVLFLFVLMFIDLRRHGEGHLPRRVDSLSIYEPAAVQAVEVKEEDRYKFSLSAALAAMLVFAVMAWAAYGLPERFHAFNPVPLPTFKDTGDAVYFGSVEDFGVAMIEDYPLHYEVVGLVVLVGVMGAVILGRRIKDEQDEAAKVTMDDAGTAAPATEHGGHH